MPLRIIRGPDVPERMERVSTGTWLDRVLGGGIPVGLTLVALRTYTERQRTTMVLAVSLASRGPVALVDCPRIAFRPQLAEAAESLGLELEAALKNLYILIPTTSEELRTAVQTIEVELRPTAVVVDSPDAVASPWELQGPLALLGRTAKKLSIPAVVTITYRAKAPPVPMVSVADYIVVEESSEEGGETTFAVRGLDIPLRRETVRL